VKRINVPAITFAIRFEVFTALAMKNTVFWDVTPCGSCQSRCLVQLLFTANVVPNASILVTLMTKAILLLSLNNGENEIKKTPWPLVRELNIPTERPPENEISIRKCCVYSVTLYYLFI
jgi:hypothetical protein